MENLIFERGGNNEPSESEEKASAEKLDELSTKTRREDRDAWALALFQALHKLLLI